MKTTTSIWRSAIITGALAALLICGCTTNRPVTNSTIPVGPRGQSHELGTGAGHLVVYSAYEVFLVGDPSYPHHTDYSVLSTSGAVVKKVTNFYTTFDSTPVDVELAAGHYLLRARAAKLGKIDVPVVIQAGRVTAVFLDAVPHSDLAGVPDEQLVILPKGLKIGFRAEP